MSEDAQLATVEPSVALMMQTLIERGITADNVDALGKMMEMHERMEERQAKRDFASALVALQGETMRVVATKAVDQKADGTCRYKFAPYEEIMQKVQPMLTRHGFSVTFDTEVGDARLTSICTLMHKSGHSRPNKFAVKHGKPPGSSDAQGDMSTKSYAKRGALCDALNISIDHDDDARAQGAPIAAEQAAELQRRVNACGANEAAFLQFAGATTFKEIGAERLPALDQMLSRKERAKKAEPERKEERDADGNILF